MAGMTLPIELYNQNSLNISIEARMPVHQFTNTL